jgi:hypothetical protein
MGSGATRIVGLTGLLLLVLPPAERPATRIEKKVHA